MSLRIIYSDGKTRWQIKKAWFRRFYHVYQIKYANDKDLKGKRVWVAAFRDRNEAVYWARIGRREREPEPRGESPAPPTEPASPARVG